MMKNWGVLKQCVRLNNYGYVTEKKNTVFSQITEQKNWTSPFTVSLPCFKTFGY